MRSAIRPSGPTFTEAARRAQLVQSAIETIASLGYAQASLARIAKHAGTSKSVISYHFGSKGELIERVVAEIFDRAVAFVAPRLQAETSASGRLRTYIEARIAFLGAHRDHLLALFNIWSDFRDEEGKLRLGEATAEPTLQALEAILREGQTAGEFRPFSTRVMAVAIRQAIDGVQLQAMTNPDIDLDLFTRELVTLFDLATRRNEP